MSDRSGLSRDRLRELLDAVVDADNSDVAEMARSSFTSEFHFSRQVSGLAGEPPAAIRRRVMLERAAWRPQRGERVAAVAADEGWTASSSTMPAVWPGSRREQSTPTAPSDTSHSRMALGRW